MNGLRRRAVKRWLELEGSGFERVSVQAAVVHLVEREKDNRSEALKVINKGRRPRKLPAEEKETQFLIRAAKQYEDKHPTYHREPNGHATGCLSGPRGCPFGPMAVLA